MTEVCQLHRDRGGAVPWVDTVGWEDRSSDNVDTFRVGRVAAMLWRVSTWHVYSCVLTAQGTLKFLNNNGLLRLAAIVWCVAPNIRQVT